MHNPAHSGPNPAALPPLQRQWLSESIRLYEQHNPLLEDGEACRIARQQGKTLQERIELRALALAKREGLEQALRQWLQATRWLAIVLAGLALLTGYGLATTALSRQAGTINVVWAMFGLLGLHLLTLLFWLSGMLLRPGQPSQFMQLPLGLLERLTRSPHAGQLSAALFSLLRHNSLLPAALSRLIHGWWSLVLLTALLVSLVLLGTHRYTFVWETTIANPDNFVVLVESLGKPGQLLGFALPDAQLIRTSGEQLLTDEASRQTWANWLMGLLVVYGLLPRLLLALWYQWRWLHGKARVRLDVHSANWTYLHARLQPTEHHHIVDPQPQQVQQPQPAIEFSSQADSRLVGLELEQPLHWPEPIPASVQQLGNLDGYTAQQSLLEQLAGQPGTSLILACDTRRSPDRGSLYFISELARSCAGLQVWLLYPDTDPQRLSGWQKALTELHISHSTTAPWLLAGATTHD